MALNDNTKRIIFVALAAILLLSIILPLVATRFENEKGGFGHRHNEALLWILIIIRPISVITTVFWLALFFYKDWLRGRIDTIERASRMRIVVSVLWWLTITMLALPGIRFFIVSYRGSDRLVFASIEFVLLSLCLGYILLTSWPEWRYFRTQPLCNIVAAYLLEQHSKFAHARNFDKAYAVLIKASEIAPDELELWCRSAFFCEMIRKDRAEADKFMAKAEELITSKKATRDSEKACYLNYLGTILYGRGDYQKGLEHIKQSIDIEPRPGRISSYEKKLSESRDKQQGPSNNAG
jgi:tetratricopeptide (TPR) repeat protein